MKRTRTLRALLQLWDEGYGADIGYYPPIEGRTKPHMELRIDLERVLHRVWERQCSDQTAVASKVCSPPCLKHDCFPCWKQAWCTKHGV